MSPEEKVAQANKETVSAINTYCDSYEVPATTRAFLMRTDVLEFLSQYKNADQRAEVISALCYGYEANILTTKDGNFRLAADGSNYLSSFTSDFLCAKVVVNGYDAKHMKTVFGNSNVSYEQIISGLKNYCYTVTTYGMNAKEPLPFKYLTNNNKNTTPVLDNLMSKLIAVNTSREAGRLTSTVTDDFISTVFDIFVLNNESIEMGQGAKDVAGAMVESFVAIQSQIANGEPLYLHENRGYARAGINLQEVDGHFAIGFPDKTTYEYTSLYDVMNHGYGSQAENAERCISEQEVLLSNITAMSLIDNPSPDADRLSLAVYLEENGLHEEARQVRINAFDAAYLYNVGVEHPYVAAYINDYLFGEKTVGNDLINFEPTCEGVDRLIGVKNTKNNYADLINNRRSMWSLNNDYTVVNGEWYTKKQKKKTGGQQPQGPAVPTPHVEVHETHEQIQPEDMTPEEQQQAQEQVEQLQQQEQQEHEQQQQQIEEGKEDLREAVEEGATQEQLEQIAEEHGIDLDEHYQEEMQAALEEQKKGEEEKKRQEEEAAAENARREEEARKRAEEEARRQEEERQRQEELIRQSQEIDAAEPEEGEPEPEPAPAEDIDQTDSDRVDEDADEQDYDPTARNDLKDRLTAMKLAALSIPVEVDDLGIGEPSGPRLG